MYDAIIDTAIGKLGIRLNGSILCGIDFDVKAKAFRSDNPFLDKVISQINAYFCKHQQKFSLPVEPQGTEFQQRVWKALQQIPYGAKLCYGDVAADLNSSARAVGNACRRNPIPIVIPCHRVVAKSGIGGFSGQTEGFQIDRKQFLLELEQES